MIIKASHKFKKQYKKLSPALQKKAKEEIDRFAKNPFEISLKNHKLQGQLKGFRSFSVTADIRIIFEERQGYVLVIFLDIGRHDHVYKSQ